MEDDNDNDQFPCKVLTVSLIIADTREKLASCALPTCKKLLTEYLTRQMDKDVNKDDLSDTDKVLITDFLLKKQKVDIWCRLMFEKFRVDFKYGKTISIVRSRECNSSKIGTFSDSFLLKEHILVGLEERYSEEKAFEIGLTESITLVVAIENFDDYASAQQNSSIKSNDEGTAWIKALEFAVVDIELKFRREMYLILEEEDEVVDKNSIDAGLIDVSKVVISANKKTWTKFQELGGYTTVEQPDKRRAFAKVNKLKEMYHTGNMMHDLKHVISVHFARLQLQHALKVLGDSKITDLVDLSITHEGNNIYAAAWNDGTAKVSVNETDIKFECFVPRTTIGSSHKDLTLPFLLVFHAISNLITHILISSVKKILAKKLGVGKYAALRITTITFSSLILLLDEKPIGSIIVKVNINGNGNGFESSINIIQKKSQTPKAPTLKSSENLIYTDSNYCHTLAILAQKVPKKDLEGSLLKCFENLI